MRLPAPRRVRAVLLTAFLVSACTDRDPASPAGPEPALPPSTVAALTCNVSVRAGTVACGQTGAGSGASAAMLGNQGQNLRLTSTGLSYDGTSIFRMNVTVENLTAQALGTADGVTPSPDGVRVFFYSGPTATGGTVEVANADGEAMFTAPAQKYFRYDGVLPPGDTSAAREWRFTVPSTVSSFTFSVLVATPVRAEGGWLEMSPIAPAVEVGDTVRIAATVRSVTGGEVGGEVAWTSSNESVVTIDAQGLARGVAAGTATLTATSGGRTGIVKVRVYTDLPRPATFGTFQVVGATVEAGAVPVDSVWFHLQYRNTGGFSPFLRVMLRHPNGVGRECLSYGPFEPIGNYRQVRCGFAFSEGELAGAWRVERVDLSVAHAMTHAELLAAGAPSHVYVTSPNEDRTAPTVDSLTILTDTVVAGQGEFRMRVWTNDDRIGLRDLYVRIGGAGNPGYVMYGQPVFLENNRVRYDVALQIPGYYRGGAFRLDSVWVRDHNLNRRRLTRADLAEAGFENGFTVIGLNPDSVPPTITAFSVSPLRLVGTGADSVTVTLTATEPADQSGVWFLDMEFEKLGGASQRRRCLLNGSTRVFTRTMTCKQAFGQADAGTWYVRYIRAIDFMDNSRELNNSQLQQAGYPDRITVTGPDPDTIPPRFAAFSFSPQTVAGNGADSITVNFTATEPENESGVWFMDVVFEKVANTSEIRRCLVNGASVAFSRTLTCRQAFTAADAGEWRVRYIRAIDFMDNRRLLRTPELQEAGYPTQLTVTGP